MKYTKADQEWARAIKDRDKWLCQRCYELGEGKQYQPGDRGLHAAHIFGRRRKSVRHDMDNGVALCFGHHRQFHSQPLEFIEFAKRWMGEDRFEALRQRAQKLAA